MIRGLSSGPSIDIQPQLASLDGITPRPGGQRVTSQPGEVRPIPIPLRPTGSTEVQVLLADGDRHFPRAGVKVLLQNARGAEA